MDEILKELLNLFRGDEPRLWKILKIVFTLAVVFIVVVALESAMGLITIGRLERQVNLLKELNTLTETGLGSQNQLEDIFNKTVSNLEQYNPDLRHTISNMLPDMLPENNQDQPVEMISAALTWVLLGLGMLTAKGGWLTKIFGCASIILIGIFLAYIISLLIETPNTIGTIALSFCSGSILLILSIALIISLYKPNPQKQSQSKSDQLEDSKS